MESLTYLKNIQLTPKKLRMYLNPIKKMSPQEALDFLMYSPTKQARIYYKAVHSAINNATQTLKVSPNMLQFKLFTIEEGRSIRRFRPGARGMVKPMKRRFSHIKIVLEEKKGVAKVKAIEPPKEEVKEVKAEKKTAPKATKPAPKKVEKKEVKK